MGPFCGGHFNYVLLLCSGGVCPSVVPWPPMGSFLAVHFNYMLDICRLGTNRYYFCVVVVCALQ